jgi:[protein-PII] uridylyltransferase
VPAVRYRRDGDRVLVTVVAADRPRLLAVLAGALTAFGFDVAEALLFVTTDGLALDVFAATDPFDRLATESERFEQFVLDALAGGVDVEDRVRARRRDYTRRTARGVSDVRVVAGQSETDTVIEVHADDEVGLLYRLASALADLDLDVRMAKVATLGARVVDTFYVRGRDGAPMNEAAAVDGLYEALVADASPLRADSPSAGP